MKTHIRFVEATSLKELEGMTDQAIISIESQNGTILDVKHSSYQSYDMDKNVITWHIALITFK